MLRKIGQPERALVCALFLCLAAWFPHFEEIKSANELSRLYLTLAMIEDDTVSIDGPLKRMLPIHDKARRGDHWYSDKAPGTSFLALPILWAYYHVAEAPSLSGGVRLARLCVSTIPTVIFLLLLLGFLGEHFPDDRWLVGLLVTGYALGSLCTTYSVLLFGHQPSGVLIFGTFLATRRLGELTGSARLRGAALAGLLASASVCVEYQNVLFLVPIAGFFLWRVRLDWRPILVAIAAALPIAILLGVYHEAAFGSPWKTGYSFLTSNFKEVHAQGFMGISTPTVAHLELSLFSPSKGVFFFAPWLLLAPIGFLFVRRAGSDGWLALGMCLLYTLFVSSMVYPVGGWTVGQRHLTPMIPWLLLPIGLLVSRFPITRGVLVGLMATAIILTGLSTVVWPHYDERFGNPFFQVGYPLFEAGYLPPSRFAWLGLSTRAGVWIVALAVGLGLSADLLRRPRSLLWRGAQLCLAALCCWVFLSSVAPLERDKDVPGHVDWIKTIYTPDPVRPPTPPK